MRPLLPSCGVSRSGTIDRLRLGDIDRLRPGSRGSALDRETPRQNHWAQLDTRAEPGRTVWHMSTTGYARVSTDDQNEASQRGALKESGCDVLYVDHASGATMERPEWQACIASLGCGDTLIVTRIDRMGRSLIDLISTIDMLGERGVHFRSLREGIDTTHPGGRLLFQITGAFAEYERELIRSRTREGLAAARDRGVRIGRPPSLTLEQKATARHLRQAGESVSSIARILGCSRRTIQRVTS